MYLLGRLRNANVSLVDFVRNRVIRPPLSWVETLAALASTLIYFDVDRKVSWVSEGPWSERRGMVCTVGFGIKRFPSRIPHRGQRDRRGRKSH